MVNSFSDRSIADRPQSQMHSVIVLAGGTFPTERKRDEPEESTLVSSRNS